MTVKRIEGSEETILVTLTDSYLSPQTAKILSDLIVYAVSISFTQIKLNYYIAIAKHQNADFFLMVFLCTVLVVFISQAYIVFRFSDY